MSTTTSARARLRARLARAHGHLHGVMDMMDEGRPDWEVLQQIVAVRTALEKAMGQMMDEMITRAAESGDEGRAAIEDLRVAIRTLA